MENKNENYFKEILINSAIPKFCHKDLTFFQTMTSQKNSKHPNCQRNLSFLWKWVDGQVCLPRRDVQKWKVAETKDFEVYEYTKVNEIV